MTDFPARLVVSLFTTCTVIVAAYGCVRSQTTEVPPDGVQSEIAARCLRAMRVENALGWRQIANRPGFRVTRVLFVRSLTNTWPDYYLLSFADAAGSRATAKVSLKGAVLQAGENPRVELPTEGEVRQVLVRRDLDSQGGLTWVLPGGSVPLEVYEPYGPLAKIERAGGAVYVNRRLRIFVEDAAGALLMQTKDGTIRLREVQ